MLGNRHSLAEYLNSENRNITYGYDELNRLVSEDANDPNGNGYSAVYEYDLAGNRLSREVTANNQGLRTEYQYYEGTDRLYKEIHTGFAARLDSGNESYYAYADAAGKFYYKDSSGKVVGAVRAFFAGLPSKLSGWLFWTVSAFLVIAFFVPNLLLRRTKQRLGFFHRGLCLLIAWIMFISPELFNQLSESAVQYSQIGRSSWGQAGKEITYEYDDNGSVTKKTTLPISEQYPYEKVYYTYDLANRLIQVKTEVSDNPTKYVEYTYNDDGIRVRAYSYDKNGSIITNKKTTVYLIDSFNHTGYAQSLEELTFLKANPNLQTDTPRSGRKYVIGDDVISQQSWVLSTISSPRYLLYDGHGSAALTTGGSTRQLAYYTGTDVTIADSYSYDGYGVLLQDDSVASSNPGKVLSTSISTNLLYAGEQFDTNSQQYNLRARWYNPLSGLFNQLDPYSGNTSDPQSLHKYLYCHANPVNGIDPSGKFDVGFNLPTLLTVVTILATIYLLYRVVWRPVVHPLIMMANSDPMSREQIKSAVEEMQKYWPNNIKMMDLANGLSGDYPIYQFRIISPESYNEGYHFLGNMYVNRRTIENQNSLAVALVLFAEFQHYPAGGNMNEQDAQREFIEVRRALPDRVRTPYINNLHHGGTVNEY